MRIVNEGTVHADEFWAYSLGSQACDLAGALYEYRGIAQGGSWRDGLHGAGSSGPKRGDPGWVHPDDLGHDQRGGRFEQSGGW